MESILTYLPIILAVAVVVVVVIPLQIKFFNQTRRIISQLSHFFPSSISLNLVETSIARDVLLSREKLEGFINNPSKWHAQEAQTTDSQVADDEIANEVTEATRQTEQEEYVDVNLIEANYYTGSPAFKGVIAETNAYLCKNVGSSADFSIIRDICERKIESLETQTSNAINDPLYIGLVGTFIGIIIGILGITSDLRGLFATDNTSPLSYLLWGVAIAMFASGLGLILMIISTRKYKEALSRCDRDKIAYYDFIRRELMPVLSNSMASRLNSLKIELTKMATQMTETFRTLKDSSDSLEVFHSYQESLNDTILNVKAAVSKIDTTVRAFDDFATSLKVVVKNQEAAEQLQSQFMSAIEMHFPTGSEAREMWRKQFDELSSDASAVSDELQKQLQASTEYIKNFVQENKDAFSSLAKLNEVIEALTQYANVQAMCYKDLKQEMQSLRKSEYEAKAHATQLNADLLTAVREMIAAIRTIKN